MPGLAELQKFKQFTQHLETAKSELLTTGQSLNISIDEFRQVSENPPSRKGFPYILAALVSLVEVVDYLVELGLGWSAIATFIWGIVRLLVTASLYIWSFFMLDGIKLIGLRRQLLKNQGRRILLAALSNAPIPYIGIILRLFPMDLLFVILTYNDQNKAVQLIWAALGNPKSIDVATNITRTRRGTDKTVTARMRNQKQA